MINFNNRKNQRGISLLEVMMSLAVIALILVLATRLYRVVQISSQSDSLLHSISSIVAAQTSYATANGTYTTYANLVPGYLPQSATVDPWGNTLALAINANGYTLTVTAIPALVCANVNPKLANMTAVVPTCPATGSGAYTVTFN